MFPTFYREITPSVSLPDSSAEPTVVTVFVYGRRGLTDRHLTVGESRETSHKRQSSHLVEPF